MHIVGRDGCALATPEKRLRTRRQFLVGAFVAVVRAAAAAQRAEHQRAEFAQADQNGEPEQRGERRRRDRVDELFEEALARVAVVREHRVFLSPRFFLPLEQLVLVVLPVVFERGLSTFS